MPLTPGTRIGPYEVGAMIGQGGMGEAYRARDTKLNRDVALKVLPRLLMEDPERRARFQREAEVLASLNHPNIAILFGLEESAVVRALAMELVEGPTLEDRIAKGPLPLEEALGIARQIAEAVEYAHDKGVIHRDLKPANIKLRPDESSSTTTAKVLDFGLAKALDQASSAAEENAGISPTLSPTLSMGRTTPGMVLGTPAYMPPEQAKGKNIDRRADVWSFGIVLFEMLTGQRMFTGDTAAEVMAAAMLQDPRLERLPANTPTAIRNLIRRCVEKEPRQRLQAIGEARLILNGSMEEPAPAPPVESIAPPRSRIGTVAWGIAGLSLLALAAVSFLHFRETPAEPQSLRFQIAPPGNSAALMFTLSPDGKYVAYVAGGDGPSRLWVHALDTLEPRALAGTEGATYPFWSPDGQQLGFFQLDKLKKIAVAGGPAQTLCDAASGRGGSWNRDGVIVFFPGPADSIFRVSSAGGVPAPVTKLDTTGEGAGHRFPVFLPDGSHVTFASGKGVFGGSLNGSEPVRLLPDITNALYAPPARRGQSGFLLFRRENTLMAQPFDAAALKTAGEMFPLAEPVPEGGNAGFGAYTVSANGVLIYRAGRAAADRQLTWMDRSGKRLGTVSKPAPLRNLALSPDDRTLAVATITASGTGSELWLIDLGRDVLTRFTFRQGLSASPVWSPDGSRIVYGQQAGGSFSILMKPADGSGKEEVLVASAGVNAFTTDWSPDGKYLVYQATAQKTAADLWLLPLEGNRKPIPYLQTPFDEQGGHFSPDGRWMAYESNESGQLQIYVQAIPASGAKYQISTNGGTQVSWRRDGKELYYVSPDLKLMAVPVTLGASVQIGTPHELFAAAGMAGLGFGASYAATRDGQRFLLNLTAGAEGAAAPLMTVVTNWQAALKRKRARAAKPRSLAGSLAPCAHTRTPPPAARGRNQRSTPHRAPGDLLPQASRTGDAASHIDRGD